MSVENTNITEWINNQAEKQLKIFMAINQKFDELGLELTEEEKNQVSSMADVYWQYYSAQYELNGIGQDSFRQLVEFDYKKEKVFLHYYGEGGEKECPDAEIGAYLEGNYSRLKSIKFDLQASDGSSLSDDELKDVKKMAEDYRKRANSGTDFDKLIEEYQEYQEKLAEEAAAAEKAENAENSEDAEEGAVTTAPVTTSPENTDEAAETTAAGNDEEAEDETDADDETSEDDEETEEAEESGEDEESDDETSEDDEAEASVTTAPEKAEEPETTTEVKEDTEVSDEHDHEHDHDDEDEDPYKNEDIYKKGSEEDGYSPSETVNNAVFNDCVINGDAVLVEDEDNHCIYLIKRLDILQRKDFFEGDQKTTILTEMFKEEFDNMAVEWADTYAVNFNDSALKRYDPFNIKM